MAVAMAGSVASMAAMSDASKAMFGAVVVLMVLLFPVTSSMTRGRARLMSSLQYSYVWRVPPMGSVTSMRPPLAASSKRKRRTFGAISGNNRSSMSRWSRVMVKM